MPEFGMTAIERPYPYGEGQIELLLVWIEYEVLDSDAAKGQPARDQFGG